MPVGMTYGLYLWNLTLENGEERISLGSSLNSVIGNLPVVNAVRGAPYTDDGVTPVVSSLVPATAQIGGPDFTLHVHGVGFRSGSQILWNGTPEPTTFVSATELTTGVNMATATVPANIPVAVRSLAGQDSNAMTFALTV